MIIHETNFEKARNEIRKNKGKEIVFSGNDDDLNRKILEKEKINVLLINLSKRRDFQKQRNSGFNHVLAKLAKKGDVTIGINLDEIVESKGKEKAELLARIRQNVVLCNKNRIKMKFMTLKHENSKDSFDLRALGTILNMPTWMTKDL